MLSRRHAILLTGALAGALRSIASPFIAAAAVSAVLMSSVVMGSAAPAVESAELYDMLITVDSNGYDPWRDFLTPPRRKACGDAVFGIDCTSSLFARRMNDGRTFYFIRFDIYGDNCFLCRNYDTISLAGVGNIPVTYWSSADAYQKILVGGLSRAQVQSGAANGFQFRVTGASPLRPLFLDIPGAHVRAVLWAARNK